MGPWTKDGFWLGDCGVLSLDDEVEPRWLSPGGCSAHGLGHLNTFCDLGERSGTFAESLWPLPGDLVAIAPVAGVWPLSQCTPDTCCCLSVSLSL